MARLAIVTAATDGHFNFAALDANHDGKISDKELAVLVIVTSPEGQTHSGSSVNIPGQNVVFEGRDSVVAEGGSFATNNHELMHQLGAIDLYGPWSGCYPVNRGLTLMGTGAGAGADNERIFGLDAWHKILLGWTEPRLVPIGRSGAAQLAAQHIAQSAEPERGRPLLVYDPAKGASEFFILEYRTPHKFGYDRNVASSGLVIWHIAYDPSGEPSHGPSERPDCHGEKTDLRNVYTRGAPDWQQGGSKVYSAEQGEIAFKWRNGSDSGFHVTVAPHKPTDAILEIKWTAPATMARAEARQ